jgi:hypothetical protein
MRPRHSQTTMVYFNMFKRFCFDGHYFSGPNPFAREACYGRAGCKIIVLSLVVFGIVSII